MEDARIDKNCAAKDDIWPLLEKLKVDLLNSAYPSN